MRCQCCDTAGTTGHWKSPTSGWSAPRDTTSALLTHPPMASPMWDSGNQHSHPRVIPPGLFGNPYTIYFCLCNVKKPTQLENLDCLKELYALWVEQASLVKAQDFNYVSSCGDQAFIYIDANAMDIQVGYFSCWNMLEKAALFPATLTKMVAASNCELQIAHKKKNVV